MKINNFTDIFNADHRIKTFFLFVARFNGYENIWVGLIDIFFSNEQAHAGVSFFFCKITDMN